jgi:uncharacterized damage-inducible protein DinB
LKPQEALELFEYDLWATGNVLDAATAAGDSFITGHSEGVGSVRDLLIHIADGQLMWLLRCKGEPLPDYLFQYERMSTTAEIQDYYGQLNSMWSDYLANVTEEDLERVVNYQVRPRGTGGPMASTAVRQIIIQVYHHGVHHRSECCEVLLRSGHRPEEVNHQRFYYAAYGQLQQP